MVLVNTVLLNTYNRELTHLHVYPTSSGQLLQGCPPGIPRVSRPNCEDQRRRFSSYTAIQCPVLFTKTDPDPTGLRSTSDESSGVTRRHVRARLHARAGVPVLARTAETTNILHPRDSSSRTADSSRPDSTMLVVNNEYCC